MLSQRPLAKVEIARGPSGHKASGHTRAWKSEAAKHGYTAAPARSTVTHICSPDHKLLLYSVKAKARQVFRCAAEKPRSLSLTSDSKTGQDFFCVPWPDASLQRREQDLR